tara:strand:- start:5020 stop:5469 length:450 start_codon:yes stop_codon:yes gene_type:complete
MPLYPYHCPKCGAYEEVLCSPQEKPAGLDCDCLFEMMPIVTMPAKTRGTWGGVDTGYFDRGLGCWVDSNRDADKIARKRGLVRASDFDKNYIEDKADAYAVEQRQLESDSQEYKNNIASGMDASDAAAKTFSVSKLKQRGMLDASIKGE